MVVIYFVTVNSGDRYFLIVRLKHPGFRGGTLVMTNMLIMYKEV